MNSTPKFGLDVPIDGQYADPHLLVEMALEAERAGWDGFYIQDIAYSSGPLLDPIVLLAAIAQQTHRMRIGAFMTALPRRRPWKLAREMLTLDWLSNGRVTLGVGLGYQPQEYLPFGESYDLRERAEKLDEGLEIIAAIFAGQPVRHAGKHYQVDLPACLPRPVQSPRIPIWTSGGWPRRKPFQRAARWDGIYVMTINQETHQNLTPQEVGEIKSYVMENRTSGTPFDIGVNVELPPESKQPGEVFREYFDAGATWFIALAPENPEEYRLRIQSGPLHLG